MALLPRSGAGLHAGAGSRVRHGIAGQNSWPSTPSSHACARDRYFFAVEGGAKFYDDFLVEGQRMVDEFQGMVFPLEHTPPARALHRTHPAGQLHGSHPPIRLAHVDRPAISTMVATRLFRG